MDDFITDEKITVEDGDVFGREWDRVSAALSAEGFAVKAAGVLKSPISWMFLVHPFEGKSSASTAAAIRFALKRHGCEKVRGIYDSLPGVPHVGIEVTRCNESDDEYIRAIFSRESWLKAKADRTAMPLALGVDAMGRDLIIDLSALSHLFIFGGDTMAQSELLNPALCELLQARDSSQFELYVKFGGGALFVLDERRNMIGGGEDNPSLDEAKAVKWSGECKEALLKFKSELERRKGLFEREECSCMSEYNVTHANRLSHSVFFLADIPAPDRFDTEGAQNAISEVEDLISELIYEDIERYGSHFVWVQFNLEDFPNLQPAVQSVIRGRDGAIRAGCLTHHTSRDEVSSLVNFGGVESASGFKTMYVSPVNEVVRVYLPN